MKKIVFMSGKFQHKLHTLTTSLNMDGDLVFEDEEAYSRADGCEVDDYLVVRSEHKNHVLNWLGQAFNGISVEVDGAETASRDLRSQPIARVGESDLASQLA